MGAELRFPQSAGRFGLVDIADASTAI